MGTRTIVGENRGSLAELLASVPLRRQLRTGLRRQYAEPHLVGGGWFVVGGLVVGVGGEDAMTFDVLQTLVEYHYWARDRLVPAVEALTDEQLRQPLGNSFSSVFDTVVHLYGADWIWRSRWEGVSPMALPSPDLYDSLAKVRGDWEDEERRIRAIVNALGPDGIARPIEYTGWDGRRQAQPFWQMLQHLVNHGSYHRGQITAMLRQMNCLRRRAWI
jgi:uncharacterized damage-inducible protein DinB